VIKPLFQQLGHAIAAIELGLGRGVQVGAQLGEGFEFTEGGQVKPQTAGHLLHGRHLGGAADARDRNTHVHRGTLAGEEQVGL